MSTAWDYNLKILKRKWPHVAKAIEDATLDDCVALNGTPSQTFSYKGQQVTSAFDPIDEAKRQAEHLDSKAKVVYCYGVGLGHLPAVLAARHKNICVVIMNATIARAAFMASKQGWLTARSLRRVAMAEEVDILYVPYAFSPMDCRLADRQGWATRDRVFAHANQRCIETFHFQRNVERNKVHISDNQKHVKVDKHISALFDTRKGSSSIVVGGGPTLSGELEWLKARQEAGDTIIAVSTALALLLKHDIKPDYTVIVDTEPRMLGHLDGVTSEQTRDIALLYHPTVIPEFIAHWHGKRYIFADNNEIFCSGTVAHTAAALAIKLGCSEVTLLGCDFCYPGQESNIPDTIDYRMIPMRPTLLETTDGYGNTVYTDFNLAQYHRHMEDFIAQTGKHAKWFKRGKGGVTVRGAEWIS